jgi:flagellar biosynthesis/type III secretory pathway protein FliH
MSLDYKAKYKELKSQLLRSTDVAYRLGYEQGMKEAQQQAQAQYKNLLLHLSFHLFVVRGLYL